MRRHPRPRYLPFSNKESEVYKKKPISPKLDVFSLSGMFHQHWVPIDHDSHKMWWRIQNSGLTGIWQWWYCSRSWYEQCPGWGACRVGLTSLGYKILEADQRQIRLWCKGHVHELGSWPGRCCALRFWPFGQGRWDRQAYWRDCE